MSPHMRLTLAVLALASVVLVGTAGFMLIEGERGLSFLDAFYMTVITVSTVGFREAFPLSKAGQIWTILTIGFGVVTVTYAFGSVVSLLVSGELRSQQVRRKMHKKIEGLQDHTIVCGYGRMGSLIVEELQRKKIDVVVVESDPSKTVQLIEAGLAYVIGDATDEEILKQAGLLRAHALVISLPTDADNVYVTLTVHTLCPEVLIIARAEQLSTEIKLQRAGATRVVCPQVIGARKMANILTRPNVVDFVEVADQGFDLEIDEYRIGSGSPLVGKSLRDANVRDRTGATIVAIKREDGETLVSPDPTSVLAANDTLILVGSPGISDRLDRIDLLPVAATNTR